MPNLQKEMTRIPPPAAEMRKFIGGEPILYAFDCALLERQTEKGFVYTAVNLSTEKTIVLSRRVNPLSPKGVDAILARLRLSCVAGEGRLQADRPVRKAIDYNKAAEILGSVFNEILPEHGYNVRAEQISLAEHILETIYRRMTTLAEAEVGTGKTLAYLVPTIIAKRGRLNDFWNKALYPKMQYAEMSNMPIVIATSSIALQRAILAEYIPALSNILLESGVIKEPLSAVIRKGKEHYICARKLREYLLFENNSITKQAMERLLLPGAEIDIAEISGITPYIKHKICVSGRCLDTCAHKDTCGYLAFRDEVASSVIDIQVCNHNYLLADTLRRAENKQPIIPNYQMLIIDEAHKFISAARSMYGNELSSNTSPDILENIGKLIFKREGYQKLARRIAKKLSDESARLFKILLTSRPDDADDDTDRYSVEVTRETLRHLRNIRNLAERLHIVLRDETFYIKAKGLLTWVQWKYGTDISSIDLKKLLADTSAADTLESQNEVMFLQLEAFHKAICALPELRERARHERELLKLSSYRIIEKSPTIHELVWKRVRRLLPAESAFGCTNERLTRVMWDVRQLCECADTFTNHTELICWLETADDENKLCAIPKYLGAKLFADQWHKSIPTVLTSGTLSASRDFTHTKRTLGLDRLRTRLSETSKPSPFNHRENALLYISENTPFPNNKSADYLTSITNEIEQLIRAAHGHTAVLFTSYDAMGRVFAELSKRKLPFPLLKLERSTSNAIEQFKSSGNGVLFASGALWEGIDIPGDALSMLIIVRLPFAVPDPISEYEQTLYASMQEYKRCVIVPEMLIKLKQGFGRLIRTEKDSGAVAILDCRVNKSGLYRNCVLNALPDCRVTDSISDVKHFITSKKAPDYFKYCADN